VRTLLSISPSSSETSAVPRIFLRTAAASAERFMKTSHRGLRGIRNMPIRRTVPGMMPARNIARQSPDAAK